MAYQAKTLVIFEGHFGVPGGRLLGESYDPRYAYQPRTLRAMQESREQLDEILGTASKLWSAGVGAAKGLAAGGLQGAVAGAGEGWRQKRAAQEKAREIGAQAVRQAWAGKKAQQQQTLGGLERATTGISQKIGRQAKRIADVQARAAVRQAKPSTGLWRGVGKGFGKVGSKIGGLFGNPFADPTKKTEEPPAAPVRGTTPEAGMMRRATAGPPTPEAQFMRGATGGPQPTPQPQPQPTAGTGPGGEVGQPAKEKPAAPTAPAAPTPTPQPAAAAKKPSMTPKQYQQQKQLAKAFSGWGGDSVDVPLGMLVQEWMNTQTMLDSYRR